MCKHLILVIFFFFSFIVIDAQNKVEFIYHDSIPLVAADSMVMYNGEKQAVNKLERLDLYSAALTPTYPIREWVYRPNEEQMAEIRIGKRTYFKESRGMIPHCINYIAIVNGNSIEIDSPEKFREIYAPVDTKSEAIAFAYFFTESYPIYNLDFLVPPIIDKPKYHYYDFLEHDSVNDVWTERKDSMRIYEPISDKWWGIDLPIIESSYVKETDYGYELLLYNYKVFGCSHPYRQRLIRVFHSGEVEIVEEKDAFYWSEDVGFCID